MSEINENDERLEPEAETAVDAAEQPEQDAPEAAGEEGADEPTSGRGVADEAADEERAEAAADVEAADPAADGAPVAPEQDAPAAPADPEESAPAAKSTVGLPVFIAAVVMAAIVGVLAGHFLLGGSSISLNGTTTITSDQLDSAIATYTFNGATHQITSREVILASSTLESAADSDGNYTVPTATEVLSYARNQVVLADADSKGVTVTDDEVAAYAESLAGSSDYASLASQYGTDEDTIKETFKSSAIMSKLRDTVCGTVSTTLPTAPTAPADDATDTPTAEYASYIINLAGDEWDKDNNTWASTDGDYYSALSTYQISNDSATYAAAQAAYYVAYSKYSTSTSQVRSEFNTYCNQLLSRATLQLGSLVL